MDYLKPNWYGDISKETALKIKQINKKAKLIQAFQGLTLTSKSTKKNHRH